MSEAIVVTLTPEEDRFDDLLQLMQNLLPGTRSFAGCTMAEVFHARENNEIVLVQMWQDSEAHDDYLDWRASNGDFDLVTNLISEEQIHRSFRVL